jgi:hypothetical protein
MRHSLSLLGFCAARLFLAQELTPETLSCGASIIGPGCILGYGLQDRRCPPRESGVDEVQPTGGTVPYQIRLRR